MTKVKQLIPELMIDGMNASDIADLVRNLEEEGFSEEGIIEILYAIEDGKSVDEAMQENDEY